MPIKVTQVKIPGIISKARWILLSFFLVVLGLGKSNMELIVDQNYAQGINNQIDLNH